jgi:hypothetical protein
VSGFDDRPLNLPAVGDVLCCMGSANDGEGGVVLTKTAQVRMGGNSVPPHLSRAVVAANYAEGSSSIRRTA